MLRINEFTVQAWCGIVRSAERDGKKRWHSIKSVVWKLRSFVTEKRWAMPKKFFIASEVRSGSTYAAELLAYALHDGKGLSFWDLTRELLSSISHKSTADEIGKVVRKIWVNEAGFSSSKIMCAQLSILCREAREDSALSNTLFGDDSYWLILRRRDRISQAVSLAFARNDGIFHAYSAEVDGAPTEVTMPDVDDALKAIALSDLFLETFAIKPAHRITAFYEDVMENRFGFIRHVAAFIGVPMDEINLDQFSTPQITPTNQGPKAGRAAQFRTWFLDNYHDLR